MPGSDNVKRVLPNLVLDDGSFLGRFPVTCAFCLFHECHCFALCLNRTRAVPLDYKEVLTP
jgi:hypothetical protein